ncbi:MAG: branched-chain amino acid ABC transporter permease [Spirochaetes bacterium]|nr:branched-chain amino acid ABC transporter permease [Spirochaetota bacterium]
MELVITTIINSLILWAMYILTALGFAFLFNMLRIFNLAHGAIYMMGGYICYYLTMGIGLNNWLALLVATILIAAFAVFLERFLYRRFAGNFNHIVMVCVVIVVVLQTTVNIMVGDRRLAIPQFAEGVFKLGAISVSYERLVTLAVGAILLAIVLFFVNKTRIGQQMRAVAQNRRGAILQGINIHRISAIAFALGCGMAAIAGCLMGAYLRLSPFMGDFMLVKVLIIFMLAGAGSIGGVIISGLILGVLTATLPVLVSGAASDAIIIGIVIILLIIRPQGFFGYEVEM